MPVLLSIYSVMGDLEKDYLGSLEKVKEMGYDGIEYPGYFGGHSAGEIRKKLDELGMLAISAHIDFNALCEKPAETIAFYRELGCVYIGIPWVDVNCLPGGERFPEFKDKIYMASAELKKRGMELMYHNHDFEFGKINGKYILDEFYDTIPADVLKTQLDLCWVSVGGADPADYVGRYASRMPVVHLKDYIGNKNESGERPYGLFGEEGKDGGKPAAGFHFRPVGSGVIDYAKVADALEKSSVKYAVVEQDISDDRPAMEAAKASLEYLRGIGF